MTMSMGTSYDDSFKRPGAVPFKWESQPGVPKHTVKPLADPPAAPSSRAQLQPPPSGPRHHHPARHPRSASASPTRRPPSIPSRTASPSASPSWKLPTPAVVSQGCFPAGASLKRRDDRSKSKGSPEAPPPRRPAPARSFAAFSAPLGRSSPPAAEVETRRRSLAFSGPLGTYSPRDSEEAWPRRGSPAFLSPLGRYHRAAEEAVSATRWLF